MLSTTVAALLGGAVGAVYGASRMGGAVEKIVAQPEASALADRIFCPAVREFGAISRGHSTASPAHAATKVFFCCVQTLAWTIMIALP